LLKFYVKLVGNLFRKIE